MNNRLGERIKQYRDEHNLSLRAFGDRAGISYTHVKNIEEGLSNPIDDDNIIKKLSNILQITIVIAPGEPIKFHDAQSNLADIIQPHAWEKDMIDFVKPENSVWIRIAKEIKESPKGIDDPEIKTIVKFLKK